jgi:LacI family transcriptional regulator, galactose operon repressor
VAEATPAPRRRRRAPGAAGGGTAGGGTAGGGMAGGDAVGGDAVGGDAVGGGAGGRRGSAGGGAARSGSARGGAGGRHPSRVTLQDVADRAGVSLTTASRVVSDGPRKVGQQMISRVHQAVAELGYTANLQARAVATGQSSTVGVVVHDIADPYFSTIAAGLMETADSRRLLVCLSSTSAGERGEREYVSLMRAQRARAVILIGSRSDDAAAREGLREEVEAFRRAGGRVVCVGQDLLGVDTIVPENAAGAESLARALVAQGHRRFAVLAGPRGLLTARDRLAGFVAGLRARPAGLDRRDIVHGAFTRDGGYEAMSTVLARGGPLPHCVFAVTDVMAVGALARLRAAGLSVPADVAVAGFDDIVTLRDVYPPLTTVRLPLKAMGEMAANLVLDDPGPGLSRIIPVPGEVVLRESTYSRPPVPGP